MSLDFIITGSGTISCFTQGRAFTIPIDHQNYAKLLEAVKNQDDKMFMKFAEPVKVLLAAFQGKLSFENGEFLLNGEFFRNTTTEEVIALYNQGFKVDNLVKFVGRLIKNPNRESIEATYTFLKDKGIPICEDGCFLAWKSVDKDFLDHHSHTIKNLPGTAISMERGKVDSNRINNCGYGFHVGTMAFAVAFSLEDGHNVLLVKIDPADVCSIPSDAECQKLRTCRYEILSVYDTELGKTIEMQSDRGGKAPESNDYEPVLNDVKIVPIKTRLPLRDRTGKFAKQV